jgi:4'-phosphopantetheinyl transferase
MINVHAYILKHSDQLPGSVFQRFLSALPDGFQQEIKSYKHWESAQASLLGKILLLHGMKKLKIEYSLKDIKTGKKDRPHIHPSFDFNISHSDEYVVAVIGSDINVGIDIEKHRNLKIDLFQKYFDEAEWAFIQNSTRPEEAFFQLWAIKESAIKCDGRGVEILSLTHIESPLQDISKGIVQCDKESFHYALLHIDDSYACSICSSHLFSPVFATVSIDEIMAMPI